MSSAKSAQESPVVGVVVTHNSEKYLPDLLASIENQTRKLDQLIVVDDNSTDSTSEILASNGITLVVATTGARDTVTRIARNFLQGAQLAPRDSIIIVGDHDDTWFPNRVEHQSKLMNKNPTIAMLASDGTTGTNQTLRSTFPVPNNWNTLSKKQQLTYVVRHSIATGGASAIRPRLLPATIPAGWLHDRWWSLAATNKTSMFIDPTCVIEYRISASQQVGLDQGGQQDSTFDWAKRHVGHAGTSLKRSADLALLLTSRLK
jgi:glycosyltransferase involved in cell wall biosynthesis